MPWITQLRSGHAGSKPRLLAEIWGLSSWDSKSPSDQANILTEIHLALGGKTGLWALPKKSNKANQVKRFGQEFSILPQRYRGQGRGVPTITRVTGWHPRGQACCLQSTSRHGSQKLTHSWSGMIWTRLRPWIQDSYSWE
jgi:hypothetical protein